MNDFEMDKFRYGKSKMPKFQFYYRKAQNKSILFPFYKYLFKYYSGKKCIDLSIQTKIGGGCYFGHPSGITINPNAIIGINCNINKGVTIGQENRGKRKGSPTIGNNVWIGNNATLVGNISIGNDVMIAPNSFVNFDVPDHSIVIGNPGIIKEKNNATDGYIDNAIKL